MILDIRRAKPRALSRVAQLKIIAEDSDRKQIIRYLENPSQARPIEQTKQVAQLLHDFFQGYPHFQKRIFDVCKCASIKKYKEGEAVFFAGQFHPREMFAVIQGRVLVLEPGQLKQAAAHTSMQRTFPTDKKAPAVHPYPINIAKVKEANMLFYPTGEPVYKVKSTVGRGTCFGEHVCQSTTFRTYAALALQSTCLAVLSRVDYQNISRQFLQQEEIRIRQLVECFFPPKGIPLFDIDYQLQERRYQFGEKVYDIGDLVDGFYLIREGEAVVLTKPSSDGIRRVKEFAITKLSSPETFGFEQLVLKRSNQPLVRRFKVRATESLKTVFLPLEVFQKLAKDYPGLAEATLAQHSNHANFIVALIGKRKKAELLLGEEARSLPRDSKYSASINLLHKMVANLKERKQQNEEAILKLPIMQRGKVGDILLAFQGPKLKRLGQSHSLFIRTQQS